MKRLLVLGPMVSGLILGLVPAALAAEQVPIQPLAHVRKLDADVWINKDEGGVYRPGESMRVYFRTSGDAYLLVFNIDTDGYIHLIYPYGAGDTPFVEGGRSYRIPARSDPYDLVADGPPGVEYVVAVASPYPFQNLPWYLSGDRADGASRDGRSDENSDETEAGYITGDPYVGIDRIIRRVAPPGREDQLATSETYFYIERRVEYPRYVCADCHIHPYFFDPYVTACSAFDIRVDATWARYAPIRLGTVRPRYIYRVRPEAPTRYRQWKQQWSSLDGKATLRTRFLPQREIRNRRERGSDLRPIRPEPKDFRRYREGRFWRGRDEILKLREPQPGGERGRVRPEARPPREGQQGDGSGARERGRPQPPEDRGSKERRPPEGDQGTVKERRPPEGDQGTVKEHQPPERDQGTVKEREQPSHGDDGSAKQQEDRGSKDRGQSRDRSEDRGDRERPSRR